MPQIIRSPKVYDVCIVGSGAAGGAAAKVLAEGGLNAVMLEAGPDLNPAKDYKEHVWPYELPHRGAGVGGKLGSDNEFRAPNGATRTEKQVHAQSFVVAASTCESARLLLNSRSRLFPDGLANSSGVVGRNVMDSVGSWARVTFRNWRKCRPTIMTAAEITCLTSICHGGSSTVRMNFPAVSTSSPAVVGSCPR
jgi:choline dehydrogenase-like flavoprotein